MKGGKQVEIGGEKGAREPPEDRDGSESQYFLHNTLVWWNVCDACDGYDRQLIRLHIIKLNNN